MRFDRLAIRCTSFLIGVILLTSGGCGKKGLAVGNVRGVVTYQGKSLTTGNISFYPVEGGEPLVAAIGFKGNYQINEIPVGNYKIAIKTPPARGKGKLPKGIGSLPPRFADPLPIPEIFADPERSGLTVNVEEGEVSHNIDLQ
jgi:hypothetical protein